RRVAETFLRSQAVPDSRPTTKRSRNRPAVRSVAAPLCRTRTRTTKASNRPASAWTLAGSSGSAPSDLALEAVDADLAARLARLTVRPVVRAEIALLAVLDVGVTVAAKVR